MFKPYSNLLYTVHPELVEGQYNCVGNNQAFTGSARTVAPK